MVVVGSVMRKRERERESLTKKRQKTFFDIISYRKRMVLRIIKNMLFLEENIGWKN